ncbi:hypothetical protein [Absidia glauca]|uniref:Uncharacterized protein n=1 Tax=Absidia glauca TaxID=4829 RepID=A0A168R5S1_ABSGL|nr:hypothetical protein [Absidia glauca]
MQLHFPLHDIPESTYKSSLHSGRIVVFSLTVAIVVIVALVAIVVIVALVVVTVIVVIVVTDVFNVEVRKTVASRLSAFIKRSHHRRRSLIYPYGLQLLFVCGLQSPSV